MYSREIIAMFSDLTDALTLAFSQVLFNIYFEKIFFFLMRQHTWSECISRKWMLNGVSDKILLALVAEDLRK